MNVLSPPVRSRKPRGQGAERRPEILAAAKRLFLEDGYAHVTMRRIAASIGVSATALYVYFPDKDSILRAIAEATFADMLDVLQRSQDTSLSALERFRAGLRAYVAFGRARPDEYRLTFLVKTVASSHAESVCPDGIEAADRSFGILEQGVAELMRQGIFAPGDSTLVAEAIWACMHGVTALLLDLSDHVASCPDALIDTVLAIATKGPLLSERC